MLTRLRVQGFKNLVDVDVQFGPFTCIAGQNGVGKSNLFDAVRFIGAMATGTLDDAARGDRAGATARENVWHVVTQKREGKSSLVVDVEMVAPRQVSDEIGQVASPTTTLLDYHVTLQANDSSFEVADETLKSRPLSHAVRFEPRSKEWASALGAAGRRRTFLSVETSEAWDWKSGVKVHEVPRRLVDVRGLQRTALSTVRAESPTALAAQYEFRHWHVLQLEPSRLREPSSLRTKPGLQPDGSGLAATLHHIFTASGEDEENKRAQVANRLATLVREVRNVYVHSDVERDQRTVMVVDRDGMHMSARDLSDGTLRFLALAAIEADPTWRGVLLVEEPENGIHPSKVPAMIDLLRAIAVDPAFPVGDDNPLRQVIINTHSPVVVAVIPDGELLVATRGGPLGVKFRCLPGTWRDEPGLKAVSRFEVSEILSAVDVALRDAGDDSVGRRLDIAKIVDENRQNRGD
jgi:predicted ATPase